MDVQIEATKEKHNQYDRLVKCILVGEAGVGKTILIHSIVKEQILGPYQSTIGIDFKTTVIDYENARLKLQIWDTAGQERFRTIVTAYYRGAEVIFVLVDLSGQDPFPSIRSHMKMIEIHGQLNACIVLVGSLPRNPNLRTVAVEAMESIAAEYNITYFELNIADHEQATQMIRTGLRLLFEGSKLEQVAVDLMPKITQDSKLEDLLKILSQICRREKQAENLYLAKIKFMVEMVQHIEHHKKYDMLPTMFLHYIDAIAGMLRHHHQRAREINVEHIPTLIRCINAIDSDAKLQSAVIDGVSAFYRKDVTLLFPNDNNFQPLIACKLMVWARERSPLKQLSAFRNIPYLGSWQSVIGQIMSDMVATVRICMQNRAENFEVVILEYVDMVSEYCLTQKRILNSGGDEWNCLLLTKLQFLPGCLPPLIQLESRLWEVLKRLETELTACPPEMVREFVGRLLDARRDNETDEEYTQRSALAIFLIQSYNLEQEINISVITRDQNNNVRILEAKSFENLCAEYSKLNKNSASYIQTTVDVFLRFLKLEDSQLKSLKLIIAAAKYLLSSPHILDVMDENDLEQLSHVLADFMCRHFDIASIVTHFQQLQQVSSQFAQELCKRIIRNMMEDILPAESYEAYLERLSATVALFAIYEPMRPHYHARMILLVNAEEVIRKAPLDRRLIKNDFHAGFSHLADGVPENNLATFVANRPVYYLQALCRCYRQNVSLAVSAISLVKQYLIASQSEVAVSEQDIQLVRDIITHQITVKEIISLIYGFSQEHLALLAQIHLPCLSDFILADKIDHDENLLQGPNSLTYKTCKLSQESLEKLAKAIMMADKHYEIINDIRKFPFRIYNQNIFIIMRMFFQNLPVNDQNVTLMIDLVEIVFRTFFRSASEFCFALNEVPYDTAISELLQSIPQGNELYRRKYISCISQITYHYLTKIFPKTITQGQSQQQQCQELLLCLIKHGANLLVPQAEETATGRKATHSMLFLLSSPHREILKRVLELYRANPQAIVDTNRENKYFDQSPLMMVICNGGNRQLIHLMLELGFSRDVVNQYLTEEYDPKIIEKANEMKKNTEALQALYIFKLKEAPPASSLLLKDIKSTNNDGENCNARIKNEL